MEIIDKNASQYKALKVLTLCISVVLFSFSLTQTPFLLSNGEEWASSLFLLFGGWMGVLTGGAGLCWLANPILFVAWFSTFKKNNTALYFSLASTLVAFLFFLIGEVMVDEAGHYADIEKFKGGYWLWLFSMFGYLIGILIIRKLEKQSNPILYKNPSLS